MAATSSPSSTGFWHWLRRASSPQAQAPAAKPANAKQQRSSNREQLFGVVRENMIRAGVLSSAYKFKVLTLDPAGQQFIVMVDWQPGAARHDPAADQALEKGLQQLARERLGFRVKAVYWRHVGTVTTAAAPTVARPDAAAAAAPGATAAGAGVLDPDAVSDNELQAFRAALRSPAGSAAAAATLARTDDERDGPTDFQPTVITDDSPATDFGALSETQYGPPR